MMKRWILTVLVAGALTAAVAGCPKGAKKEGPAPAKGTEEAAPEKPEGEKPAPGETEGEKPAPEKPKDHPAH